MNSSVEFQLYIHYLKSVLVLVYCSYSLHVSGLHSLIEFLSFTFCFYNQSLRRASLRHSSCKDRNVCIKKNNKKNKIKSSAWDCVLFILSSCEPYTFPHARGNSYLSRSAFTTVIKMGKSQTLVMQRQKCLYKIINKYKKTQSIKSAEVGNMVGV